MFILSIAALRSALNLPIEESQTGPEVKDDKMALVPEPNTTADKEAVMVTLEHTNLAEGAMMRARRSRHLADQTRLPRPGGKTKTKTL